MDLNPQRLLELLTEQRELYARLRELSERQRSLISGDRPERLLNILRDRQTLVSALVGLNEKLGPYRRDWDRMYNALPESTRTRASGLLQEINGLLQVILKTDREDSALLAARKQSVAQAMSTVSGGQIANAAYARQTGSQAGAGSADVSG